MDEYEKLKERINIAINAISKDKCSGDSEWSDGVNSATKKHSDMLKAAFSDIYVEMG